MLLNIVNTHQVNFVVNEIKNLNYIPYIINDYGKYNTKFVEAQFLLEETLHKSHNIAT